MEWDPLISLLELALYQWNLIIHTERIGVLYSYQTYEE